MCVFVCVCVFQVRRFSSAPKGPCKCRFLRTRSVFSDLSCVASANFVIVTTVVTVQFLRVLGFFVNRHGNTSTRLSCSDVRARLIACTTSSRSVRPTWEKGRLRYARWAAASVVKGARPAKRTLRARRRMLPTTRTSYRRRSRPPCPYRT